MKSFGAAVAMGLAAAAQIAAAAPATLCDPMQIEYFACDVGNGERVALCGRTPAFLEYRQTSRHRAPYRYPAAGSGEGEADFALAHYFRAQIDRTEVSFSDANRVFVVFDYLENGRRQAGVRVTDKAPGERVLQCRSPVRARLEELKGHLRCDPDNALNLGGCRQ
jgi:hypothetical protein